MKLKSGFKDLVLSWRILFVKIFYLFLLQTSEKRRNPKYHTPGHLLLLVIVFVIFNTFKINFCMIIEISSDGY